MTFASFGRTVMQRRSADELSVRALRRQFNGASTLTAVLLVWFAVGVALYSYRGDPLGLLILAVPLLICLAVTLAQHQRGAAVGWLLVSPLLHPLIYYPHGHAVLTFDRLWLLPLGLAFVMSRSSPRPTRLGLLGRGGLAFVLLFGVRAASSGSQIQSSVVTWLDAILLPLALFLVVRQLAVTKANRLRMAGAMAWGGTLVAALGVTERLFGYELASLTGGVPRTDSGLPGVVRVSGPYNVPEVYSLILVSTLAATLYWWQSSRRQGGLVTIAVALQVVGLANSLFRVSWISGLLVLVVALGFRPRRLGRAVAAVVGTALLGVFALLPLESSSVFTERVGNTSNVSGRFATYLQAVDIFKTSPTVGVGIGNYNAVASQRDGVYIGGVRSLDFAHSSFLDVLAEQGVVGFLPLLAVAIGLALLARQLWRTGQSEEQKILAATVLAALIGYFTFSLTLTMITYGDSNAYFAALVGIGAGALTEIRNLEQSAKPLADSRTPFREQGFVTQRG